MNRAIIHIIFYYYTVEIKDIFKDEALEVFKWYKISSFSF